MATKKTPDVPAIPLPPESVAPAVEPAPDAQAPSEVDEETRQAAPAPAAPADPSPYVTDGPPVPPAAAAAAYVRPDPYATGGYAPQTPYVANPQPAFGASYTPGPPQGLAIASLVCGIAGVVLFFSGIGFLPALAGVILGHIAQKRQPYARGLWLTGLITGYIGVALGLLVGIAILAAIFIPLFLAGQAGALS
jgi:hypothetical protein